MFKGTRKRIVTALVVAACLAGPVAAHATDLSMDTPYYAGSVVKSLLNWLNRVFYKPVATVPADPGPAGKFGAGHSSDGHLKDTSVARAPLV